MSSQADACTSHLNPISSSRLTRSSVIGEGLPSIFFL
eukprot:CAMPEP_0185803594 /NCGR_PEP_ID=MMETSP1322-20130828/2746_1 /TAXON_ID=265543 /ORGANISM="Minutocellus polymorphus, Strain RCC2270" /LENGTH=36 /DNA_ID= /DNA_START= /DNA_END= /DNA_ORIENTATION=